MTTKNYQELLYKDLSYQIQGAAIEVRKDFGSGHKESIYQNALAEELKSRNINFEREQNIKIYSPKTHKVIGYYKPDFVIDNKVIVELKAVENIPKIFVDQLYDYLRNSEYELGYFINFASPKLYMKRIIFTNDRKFSQLKKSLLVAFSSIFVSISVLSVHAAELNFSPPKLIEETESTYAIDLNLDTQGDNINVLEASLNYSVQNFNLKNILTGDSIVNFWIKKPETQNNLIHFVGYIPAGYFGSKGKVITLVFQPKTESTILDIGIINDKGNPSRVFLNDPLATEKNIGANHYSFNLFSGREEMSTANIVDVEKPEPFIVTISQSSLLPINNVFVIFNTNDTGSGIDHYEMAQADLASDFSNNKSLKWQIVESPVTLNISQAKRFLAIKAFDKSNNVELSVLDLKPSKTQALSQNPFTVSLILFIIIGTVSFSCYRRFKKNK